MMVYGAVHPTSSSIYIYSIELPLQNKTERRTEILQYNQTTSTPMDPFSAFKSENTQRNEYVCTIKARLKIININRPSPNGTRRDHYLQ